MKSRGWDLLKKFKEITNKDLLVKIGMEKIIAHCYAIICTGCRHVSFYKTQRGFMESGWHITV